MRNILFILLFLLTACQATTFSQLTDAERALMKPVHHVYAARLDYNRLLQLFLNYSRQPPCSETLVVACSEGVVVLTALDYFREVDTMLDQAEVIVRGGGDTPESLLSGSRRALATLSAYLVAKEIVK
jgi:hypothetical protein